MDDEGNSSLVYPHNVQVSTVYDPKGMLVTIKESSELKEFVITSGSEFARVGRKGMIIKLSTETLLLTFASDEVRIIDYRVQFYLKCDIQDSNTFSESFVQIKADKSSSVFR